MQREVARQKKFSQKPTVADLARVTAPFVLGLMSDARRRELGRITHYAEETKSKDTKEWLRKILHYIHERRTAMTRMSAAVWRFAESLERERGRVRR